MTTNKNKIIYQILAFLIPFCVYLITLAPTVTFIDSGELAAVASKLGVAHPTGYPLFTILGRIFTFIPVNEEVYRLNLMCAVISSAAILMFFNLMVFLIKNKNLTDIDNNETRNISDDIVYNISLAAALVLAFSKTFWETANAIEVYSLHSFFLVTNIYLILKACSYNPKDESSMIKKERYWLLYAFVLGLSFTNHLSTIFLSVGSIYLYFAVNGFNKNSFKRILILVIPFLLGFSVYIYFSYAQITMSLAGDIRTTSITSGGILPGNSSASGCLVRLKMPVSNFHILQATILLNFFTFLYS
ncbi:MAG: DUF2723 domain-containing protein [Ignavibacteria bacterium]|nr:DUF2723 domain-containing protein [Ignavibacteria bacterium]